MRVRSGRRGIKPAVGALSAVVLVLQVTACAGTTVRENPIGSGRAPALVDRPVEPVGEVGAHITEAEAQDVLSGSKTNGAYRLRSGDWVLTDLKKPLPKEAQRDADRAASRLIRKNASGKHTHDLVLASQNSIRSISSLALDSPDRQVVTLLRTWNGAVDTFPSRYVKVWIINGIAGDGRQLSSKEAGIAAYKKYVRTYYKSGVRPALVIGDIDS